MEMKSIKIDGAIKTKLSAPIPDYLIKQREGGGKKMLSYLSGSTVTDMLNDAFGYAWSWEIKEQWIQESQPFFNTYSKSKEKIFYNGREGAWEEQGSVAHVKGTLIVYMQVDGGSIVELRKEGYGSKSILGKQNDQESIFKAAGTDALKKAASLFGIGLELYRDESEQAYFDIINYEDPWTEENIAKYSESKKFIDNYLELYSVSEDDFANYIYELTGVESYLTPENITLVEESLKEAMKTE